MKEKNLVCKCGSELFYIAKSYADWFIYCNDCQNTVALLDQEEIDFFENVMKR